MTDREEKAKVASSGLKLFKSKDGESEPHREVNRGNAAESSVATFSKKYLEQNTSNYYGKALVFIQENIIHQVGMRAAEANRKKKESTQRNSTADERHTDGKESEQESGIKQQDGNITELTENDNFDQERGRTSEEMKDEFSQPRDEHNLQITKDIEGGVTKASDHQTEGGLFKGNNLERVKAIGTKDSESELSKDVKMKQTTDPKFEQRKQEIEKERNSLEISDDSSNKIRENTDEIETDKSQKILESQSDEMNNTSNVSKMFKLFSVRMALMRNFNKKDSDLEIKENKESSEEVFEAFGENEETDHKKLKSSGILNDLGVHDGDLDLQEKKFSKSGSLDEKKSEGRKVSEQQKETRTEPEQTAEVSPNDKSPEMTDKSDNTKSKSNMSSMFKLISTRMAIIRNFNKKDTEENAEVRKSVENDQSADTIQEEKHLAGMDHDRINHSANTDRDENKTADTDQKNSFNDTASNVDKENHEQASSPLELDGNYADGMNEQTTDLKLNDEQRSGNKTNSLDGKNPDDGREHLVPTENNDTRQAKIYGSERMGNLETVWVEDSEKKSTKDSELGRIRDSKLERMNDSKLDQMRDSKLDQTKNSKLCRMKDFNLDQMKDSKLKPTKDFNLDQMKDSKLKPTKDSKLKPTKDSKLNITKDSDSEQNEQSESLPVTISESKIMTDNKLEQAKDSKSKQKGSEEIEGSAMQNVSDLKFEDIRGIGCEKINDIESDQTKDSKSEEKNYRKEPDHILDSSNDEPNNNQTAVTTKDRTGNHSNDTESPSNTSKLFKIFTTKMTAIRNISKTDDNKKEVLDKQDARNHEQANVENEIPSLVPFHESETQELNKCGIEEKNDDNERNRRKDEDRGIDTERLLDVEKDSSVNDTDKIPLADEKKNQARILKKEASCTKIQTAFRSNRPAVVDKSLDDSKVRASGIRTSNSIERNKETGEKCITGSRDVAVEKNKPKLVRRIKQETSVEVAPRPFSNISFLNPRKEQAFVNKTNVSKIPLKENASAVWRKNDPNSVKPIKDQKPIKLVATEMRQLYSSRIPGKRLSQSEQSSPGVTGKTMSQNINIQHQTQKDRMFVHKQQTMIGESQLKRSNTDKRLSRSRSEQSVHECHQNNKILTENRTGNIANRTHATGKHASTPHDPKKLNNRLSRSELSVRSCAEKSSNVAPRDLNKKSPQVQPKSLIILKSSLKKPYPPGLYRIPTERLSRSETSLSEKSKNQHAASEYRYEFAKEDDSSSCHILNSILKRPSSGHEEAGNRLSRSEQSILQPSFIKPKIKRRVTIDDTKRVRCSIRCTCLTESVCHMENENMNSHWLREVKFKPPSRKSSCK